MPQKHRISFREREDEEQKPTKTLVDGLPLLLTCENIPDEESLSESEESMGSSAYYYPKPIYRCDATTQTESPNTKSLTESDTCTWDHTYCFFNDAFPNEDDRQICGIPMETDTLPPVNEYEFGIKIHTESPNKNSFTGSSVTDKDKEVGKIPVTVKEIWKKPSEHGYCATDKEVGNRPVTVKKILNKPSDNGNCATDKEVENVRVTIEKNPNKPSDNGNCATNKEVRNVDVPEFEKSQSESFSYEQVLIDRRFYDPELDVASNITVGCLDAFNNLHSHLTSIICEPFLMMKTDTIKIFEMYEKHVKLCISINTCLCLTLYVHGIEIHNIHPVLTGIQTDHVQVSDIKKLLNRLEGTTVCSGNTESEFVNFFCSLNNILLPAYKENYVGAPNYSSTVRSFRCKLLINKPNTRCADCCQIRKALQLGINMRKKGALETCKRNLLNPEWLDKDNYNFVFKIDEQRIQIESLMKEVEKLKSELIVSNIITQKLGANCQS